MDTTSQMRLNEMHAELCKVFTSPVRVGVLILLRDGEKSVGDISQSMGLAQPTVSKHLLLMRNRGILAARKDAQTVYYRLRRPAVLKAFDIIRELLLENLEEDGRLARSGGAR